MTRSRRTIAISVGAVMVLASAGVAGWWFLIREDAPERASIEEAARTLDERAGPSGSDDSPTGLEGTWVVDERIGTFDYASDTFTSTWAGYRFDEQLAGIGANVAVGRTPEVTGSLTVAGGEVTAVEIEVDLFTLESDDDRRDNAIRGQGLETDTFRTASFVLSEPAALPAGIEDGERVQASITGDLTIHGVTNNVTLDVEAELDGDTAVIVGDVPVTLADFDIEPPTNALVLSVAETGSFEFQIFFSRGP